MTTIKTLIRHKQSGFRHRVKIAKRYAWREQCVVMHDALVRKCDEDGVPRPKSPPNDVDMRTRRLTMFGGGSPSLHESRGINGFRPVSLESWDNAIRASEEDR